VDGQGKMEGEGSKKVGSGGWLLSLTRLESIGVMCIVPGGSTVFDAPAHTC